MAFHTSTEPFKLGSNEFFFEGDFVKLTPTPWVSSPFNKSPLEEYVMMFYLFSRRFSNQIYVKCGRLVLEQFLETDPGGE